MSKRNRDRRAAGEQAEPSAARPPGRGRTALWAVPALLLLALGAAFAIRQINQRVASQRAIAALPNFEDTPIEKRVAHVLREARDAVLAEPDSAAAWGRYGMVLDAHRELEAAIICYSRARELEPRAFRWTYLLALARDLREHPPEEVMATFEAAATLRPDYPPLQLSIGDALMRLGQPAAARAVYSKAIALDAGFVLAHRNLGQALISLDEAAAAVKELEKAREAAPTDPVLLSSLARAYTLVGDSERASEAAAAAALKGPEALLDDPERAAVAALAVDPASTIARAQKLMALGRWREALVDLKRFEQTAPEHPVLHFHLGTTYLELGELELAATHFSKALSLREDLTRAHIGLAIIAVKKAEYAQAVIHYRRAMELEPPDADLLRTYARVSFMARDFAGAADAFAGADALEPTTDPKIRELWGRTLHVLGRFDDAAAQFREEIALRPEEPEPRYLLGLTMERLGRIDEAVALYREVTRADPKNEEAAARLSKLGRAP